MIEKTPTPHHRKNAALPLVRVMASISKQLTFNNYVFFSRDDNCPKLSWGTWHSPTMQLEAKPIISTNNSFGMGHFVATYTPPNTLLEYFQFSLPFQAFSSPYQTVNLDYRFKLTMLPQMIADGTLSWAVPGWAEDKPAGYDFQSDFSLFDPSLQAVKNKSKRFFDV